MRVLELMNREYNWKEILQEAPYFINIKEKDDYVLLKYNQIFSDFSNEIVRECRGAIFRKNVDGRWICISRGFDKFGNFEESYAPKIDWESAIIMEKVDGSLIRCFWDNGKWHIATNGQIDAFETVIDDRGWTFGHLVYKALGGEYRFNKLTMLLDPNFTYMFELVSPMTQVIIPYPETKLYYLGARDMVTMRENKFKDYKVIKAFGISIPKHYPIHNIAECIGEANRMTKDEEGFVVVDKNYNRIKVKSPEYLRAARLNNNNRITIKRVVEMMREEQLDDFIAYCPQHEVMVNKVIGALKEMEEECAKEWEEVKEFACKEKKEFVSIVKDKGAKWPNYLYWKYSNSEGAPSQFFNKMSVKAIIDLIRRRLNEKGN